ncbi:MAG: hypothetical protein ACLP0B_02255 [Steroidobacteraceae bacterium]
MIKKILAIIAAAICAGAIVEFAPESAPAVAAGVSAAAQSQATSISDRAKPAALDAARIAERGRAICSRVWPYYEPACWHDDRGSDGKIRVVRVIVADRSVTGGTLQTRP